MFMLNLHSCLITKGITILWICKDQEAERLLCSCVFIFLSIYFLHSDILDLPYFEDKAFRIILYIMMHSGGKAAAPHETSIVLGTLKARAAAAGGSRSSSPALLLCSCWCRYCYRKTGQGMEMCYSRSSTLCWPKGHSSDGILGQNKLLLIRLGSLLGFGGLRVFLALFSTVSLWNKTWDFWWCHSA